MSLKASLPQFQRDLKPLQSLAKASSACSAQGTIYAECVFKAQFGEGSAGVEKDVCRQEFMVFKECVQEKVREARDCNNARRRVQRELMALCPFR
jgi:hypothetical protein